MAIVKFPYSQIYVHDGIIFAARAGRIESFDLHSSQQLSTWIHPDTEKFVDQVKPPSTETAEDAPVTEPPSKRQKISEEGEGQVNQPGVEVKAQEKEQVEGSGEKAPKQIKPKQVDRPVIIQVTGTADGKHVVAVSGHDKTIWVFEHVGTGQLRQLSKRAMPKRPSTITVGPGAQIISADKFGDVYALPLIPDESKTSVSVATRWKPAKPMTKTAATELTVHSKKNLNTLREQQRMIELNQQKLESGQPAKENEPRPEAPDFELSLLLGHVSTVTALVLGENRGRPVIITGDRDEHVRVSRYIPQAHVIEGFCLGHKEFVSSLVVPRARGEILVSGGGDEELFVWNWQTGGLLSKVSLLSLAQEVAPEATKVALSKLVSFDYTSESDASVNSCILAICEGIKAIFCWYLTEANELKFPSIVQVPGYPLDVALTQSGSNNLPTLVVGLDISEESEGAEVESLNVYELVANEGKIAVGSLKAIANGGGADSEADIDASVDETKCTLYGFENLRKARVDCLAEAEADADDDAGPGEGTGEEVAARND